MTTRSQSERLQELETEQSRIGEEVARLGAEQIRTNQTLADHGTKLETMNLTLGEHGAKLEEIASSLAAITKALIPPKSPTGDEVGAHISTLIVPHSDGEGRTSTPTPLPTFDGGDPIGWLARVEQQFELQATLPEKKVAAAMVAMEGGALYWVTWLRSRKPNLCWDDFKQALVTRFDSRYQGNRFERLSGVKQDGTVEDYNILFVQLASQVPGLTDDHYMGYYMNGLKEEIKCSLRLLRPDCLETAMELAHGVEHKLLIQNGGKGGANQYSSGSRPSIYPRSNPGFFPSTGSSSSSRNPSGSIPRVTGQPMGPTSRAAAAVTGSSGQTTERSRFTRLPTKVLDELRAKGLCFKCRKPFTPGHDCPFKQLRVMLAEEDEEFDFQQHDYCEITGNEELPLYEEPPDGENSDFPVYAMAGIFSPQTMRLRGIIKGCSVTVLIDSGASHNFVSSSLVSLLHLTPDKTGKFGVQLGDGHRQESEGVCRQLPISLPGCAIKTDCFVFPLAGVDLILGVAWLATLGEVRTNWNKLTMQFKVNGKQVELKGDPSMCKNAVSLRSLLKTTDKEFGAVVLIREASKMVGATADTLEDILGTYAEIFSDLQGLPPQRSRDHRIELVPGAKPVSVRPYRYGHLQKDEIERLVDEMLQAGIIQPSTSPLSSPVLLVKKKDGSWRFCVDYRELNKSTIPDKYPIPVIQDMLDELAGAVVFSKIDLRSGYHQIRVAKTDVHKTAFRTHTRHYEFRVMPFGLTNAPATFQAIMNDLFRPYLRKFVLVFFDDILVYSKTWAEHREQLDHVLSILKAHQFRANRKKCSFGQPRVEYLGHIISQAGVAMDPAKVSAVVEWPRPKSVREIRGFLGLTGYYRRFVREYGLIARPLTNLLKKEALHRFQWTEEAERAFRQLQKALTEAPVLAMPQFDRQFVVECDASGIGVGAVLMQERRPIAYFSKSLANRTLSKSAYEREMMGLALAVQHWRPYLIGRKFIVRTDHRSLKHLLTQRIATPSQQVWVAKLLGYDFDIEYKTGISNTAADALSRRGEEAELAAISIPEWIGLADIEEEQRNDTNLRDIIQAVEADPNSMPGYELKGRRLIFKGRLVLASDSKWIPLLLKEFHDTPTGGHAGAYRTYRRLAMNVTWRGMFRRVRAYVAQCLVCQKVKYEAASPAGLLQPLPIPNLVWEDISMDFITCLPKSKGHTSILVVVDRLSKYGHFIALKAPITARSVAETFAQEIVRLHGIPRSIVSDRDSLFVSAFWKEIFALSGTQLKFSSAYHPETDGQTEVLNRVLETYLRCFTCEQPRQWIRWLPWAEYWYNTAFQTAAGISPFEVVYGRPPPTIRQYLPGEGEVAAVADVLGSRDVMLKRLKENLQIAQQRMATQANKHRRDVTFQVGDKVFLKVRPHRQTTLFRQPHNKLSAKFYGPFLIEARIGPTAYRLALPPTSRIHPVFHTSQLRRVVRDHPVESNLPESLELPVGPIFEPEEILATRKKNDKDEELLVKWAGQSTDDATWMDKARFRGQFPDFNLEDKVLPREDEVDTEQQIAPEEPAIEEDQGLRPWIVYRRRGRDGPTSVGWGDQLSG
ncbi:unnamed protein product [Cuscuta epithymum]|uniref:Reverse transcriptase n=1 Tax=Cuscuta epithymum TaxID=186058 RepID=A0AAV0CKG0_9ASTE|nr:unnamed protein product [Cuscuta epithymum]